MSTQPSTVKHPLRLALIGAGGIGSVHLNTLLAMEAKGQIRLMAVTDPAVERLAERKTKLEASGVRWYSDYRVMLDRESDLEAVIIATPIPVHFEMVSACIEQGLFINLEKPPVPLIEQLDKLDKLDRANRVAVCFQHICTEPVQQLKQWIGEGKLGELRTIRVTGSWPRSDKYYNRTSWAGKMVMGEEPVYDGPATNALAHVIHTVMYLAGDGPEAFASPARIQAELYRIRPIESYDLICMRGWFGSGLTFEVSLTHAGQQNVPFRIEVRGTRDCARISQDGNLLESSAGVPPNVANLTPEPDRFAPLHGDFVEFAQGIRSRPRTRLADTRGFLLATNGALLSSKGIHDVDETFIRCHGEGDSTGYEVKGLPELMERGFREGLLFSEMDAPWARSTSSVSVDDIRREGIRTLLNKPVLEFH